MKSSFNVIHPAGILNSTQGNTIRQEVSSLLESGTKLILIDLKDITFVDSSGLGALVMAFKSTRSAGGKLYLCSVGEQPHMLFELTGMQQVFEVFSNQDEFNKAMEVAPAPLATN